MSETQSTQSGGSSGPELKVTKHGHSCVSVSWDADGQGRQLVMDPGNLLDAAAALEGAQAVLITHLHPDHMDVDALLPFLAEHPEVPVYLPQDAADALLASDAAPEGLADRLHVVAPDEDLTVLGLPIRTLGGQHALIHPLLRTIGNVGYILDGRVYHPGDSLIVPPGAASLDVVLVPGWAPWSKTSEVVDFVAAVRAKRAYTIHDAHLKEAGLKTVAGQLTGLGGRTGTEVHPWSPGESFTA